METFKEKKIRQRIEDVENALGVKLQPLEKDLLKEFFKLYPKNTNLNQMYYYCKVVQ